MPASHSAIEASLISPRPQAPPDSNAGHLTSSSHPTHSYPVTWQAACGDHPGSESGIAATTTTTTGDYSPFIGFDSDTADFGAHFHS